ncbi:potassium channel-like protein [Hyaloscypha sp. PMI_1271]|nr:potassium channel-like protein [Hyaloscypha sp. PMI_1271]
MHLETGARLHPESYRLLERNREVHLGKGSQRPISLSTWIFNYRSILSNPSQNTTMRNFAFWKWASNLVRGRDRQKEKGREPEASHPTEQGPSRWWFPYPLIAGTCGPIASAFSVCALTVPWRVATLGQEVQELANYIDNPKWLIGVNAAQLAVALISNLFLFLNMAGRVRFSIAQCIIIIGWYISSVSLIALTATVATLLKFASPSEYALTQAYYYAVFSAVLYFFVATMMVVTVFGFYKGHYDEEFKLTVRRRSLMIQTSGFLFYLLSGAAVYAHIEDWKYLDAVYWADYTILTVGIGDFAPSTHVGRSLLFPFATGGIIIIGLIICTIRSLVVDRGKVKMGTILVEKLRQRVLKELQKGQKGGTLDSVDFNLSRNTYEAEFHGSRQEFELMRQIQDQAITKRRWASLLISASAWFVLWFVSASIFKATEKAQSWSYFDSLYFTFTSLLTIGYGDFYPTSPAGKAYFVFWSLLAVPSLTILISNMGDTIVRKIGDVLLWAGDLAIFAPEGGFKASFKRADYRATKATRFKSDTHETDSTILDNTSHNAQTFPEFDSKPSAITTQILSPAAKSGVREAALTRERRKNLLCLLVKEIGAVITHAKSYPPTRYTFDEWAWYVKLLSEGESGSGLDRVSPGIRDGGGESLETAMSASRGNDRQEETRENWSWIGDHSPLMADKGEPEWLLEGLLKMMERELRNL